MPLGIGESVGSAYVRIIADGSDLPDGIRDAMRDAEPTMEAAGVKHGKAYTEARDKAIVENNDRLRRQMADALTLGAADMDAIATSIDNGIFDDLEKKIAYRVKNADLANVIRNQLETDFRNGASFETLLKRLEKDLPRVVRTATAQVRDAEERMWKEKLKEYDQGLADQLRLDLAYDKEVERLRAEELVQFRRQIEEKYRLEDEALERRLDAQRAFDDEEARRDQERTNRLRRQLQEQAEAFDLVRRNVTELRGSLGKLNEGTRESTRNIRRVTDALRANREYLLFYDPDDRTSLSAELDRVDRRLRRLTPQFDRTNRTLGTFENFVGRSTGRGSRNNFLNLIGSMTQGVTSLLGVLPRLGARLTDAFNTGGLQEVAKVSFSTLAKSGVALVAALAAIAVALGPVIAAFSLLLGTVTALAASLSFALVGALAATAAAFVPLAFGIGAAVLAFQGLDEAQKKALKNDFRPLIDQAKALRNATADSFFDAFNSEGVSANLTAGVRTAVPLFESLGAALADVAQRFSQIGTSDAYRQFISAMERVLPGAVRDLGDGLAGFAEGFLGVMRALSPTIRSVADSIGDAGERFGEWANSAEGQRTLKTFFADAAESLEAVKGFLGDVLGLIGDLFSTGGKDAGDTLFKDMEKALERFRESLTNGEIQKWFEDSIDFARRLGRAFVAVGEVFDTLDNGFNRGAAKLFFEFIIANAKVVEGAFKGMGQGVIAFGQLMLFQADLILQAFNFVAEQVGNLLGAILDDFADTVGTLADLPGGLGAPFAGLEAGLRGAADGVRGLGDEMDGAREKIAGLQSGLGDIAAGVSPSDLSKLNRLRETIVNIPDEKLTEIVASGTELSFKQVKKLQAQYDLNPEQLGTLVSLLGDDKARENIHKLIEQAQEFDKTNPRPDVSIDDRATGDLRRIILLAEEAARDRNATITTTYVTRRVGADPDGIPYATGGGGGGGQGTASRMVDPALQRILSSAPAQSYSGGTGGVAQRGVDASGWTIVTPSEDPRAVAAEVLNELTARVI